ncbi:MAG TPA: hypothetical protein VF553_07030 [Pyrinomonadaceae bacterium]
MSFTTLGPEFALDVVKTLVGILESAAAKLTPEDLLKLASVPSRSVIEVKEEFDTIENQKSVWVSLSKVNDLATRELEQRGINAKEASNARS